MLFFNLHIKNDFIQKITQVEYINSFCSFEHCELEHKNNNTVYTGDSCSTNNINKVNLFIEHKSNQISAGFTYRLDRLKPRASLFRGPPTKVYNIFNTVIGLSHLCCHSVSVLSEQPFSNFPYSISEYCRILNTPHLLCLY